MKHRAILLFCAFGLALTGMLVATAPSDAQVSKQGNGFMLRMKFTKGVTYKYSANIALKGTGANQPPMSMPFSTKITDVKGDVATMQFTATAPGQSKPEVKTAKINTRGKIVSGDKDIQQFASTVYPDGPVTVGQSWTNDVEVPGMMGTPMKIKSTHTFKGLKTVNSRQVAEIAVKMTGGAHGLNLTGTGTMLVNASDGHLQRATIAQKMTMTQQGANAKPMSFDVDVTIMRS